MAVNCTAQILLVVLVAVVVQVTRLLEKTALISTSVRIETLVPKTLPVKTLKALTLVHAIRVTKVI